MTTPDLTALLQRCCAELPDGYEIRICIQRGDAWVKLEDLASTAVGSTRVVSDKFWASIEAALEVAQIEAANPAPDASDDDTDDYPAVSPSQPQPTFPVDYVE